MCQQAVLWVGELPSDAKVTLASAADVSRARVEWFDLVAAHSPNWVLLEPVPSDVGAAVEVGFDVGLSRGETWLRWRHG